MKLSQLNKIDANAYVGKVAGFEIEVWRPWLANGGKHWHCVIDGTCGDNVFASGPRKTAAGALSAALAHARRSHERLGKLLRAAK
jgi:hypothetical protein